MNTAGDTHPSATNDVPAEPPPVDAESPAALTPGERQTRKTVGALRRLEESNDPPQTGGAYQAE